MGTLRLGSSVVVPSTVKQTTVPASIDPLSITPTTSQQVINATASIDGYAPVTVNAVTSAIDANISSENIKNGVSILGVTGTYEGGGSFLGIPKENYNGMLISSDTMIDLTNITSIGTYALAYAYYNTPLSGNLSFPTITKVYDYGMYDFNSGTPYSGQLGVRSLSFANLVTAGNQAFRNFMSSSNYANFDGNIDFSSLETAGNYCFMNAFNYLGQGTDTKINSVDFSSLQTAGSNCFDSMFSNVGVRSINFSSLQIAGSSCFRYAFAASYSLSNQNVTFPSLNNIGYHCFQYAFVGCTLTSISFPAVTSQSFYDNGVFNGMLSGCSNVTVHFPSNLQSTMSSWSDVTSGFGGTNTTVLFDLPATE